MGSCYGKRDSVRYPGRVWARHQVSHRVGVVLSLFALLAMLASHVIHTVEVLRMTTRAGKEAAHGSQGKSCGTVRTHSLT